MPFHPPNKDWQLAEVNIARLKAPMGDPLVQPFVDAIDRINGIAERMDGFVWRHEDPADTSEGTLIYDDPKIIYNASTWRDVPSLEKFVWGTLHKRFYQRRQEWFELLDSMHFAMWWIPAGQTFSPSEAKERLDYLQKSGPTDYAFGWKDAPGAKLWLRAG